MFPTLMAFGLILGIIPALPLRAKAGVTVVAAAGWATYVALGLDVSWGSAALGFVLAAANAAIGIAMGIGMVACVRWVSRHTRNTPRSATATPSP